MEIRPHHLLCMGKFIGKGYSKEFVLNMRRVISSLEAGGKFTLTDGADDICKACPYNIDGVCKDIEKVRVYDGKAKDALGIEYGKEYVYSAVNNTVKQRIYGKGKLKDICGDCEWAEICSDFIQMN